MVGKDSTKLTTDKKTPTASEGDIGEVCFDESFLYICTDDKTWKKIPLTPNEENTKTNFKGHIEHGATAATTRPTGFDSVEWVGSVEPTNAVNGDTWIKRVKIELIDDLVSYYKLDETSGTTAEDSHGSNDGTYNGDLPTAVTGKINNAQDFDGTGDKITTGTEIIKEKEEATINVWVKADANDQTEFVVSQSADDQGRQRVGIRTYLGNWQAISSQSDLTQRFVTLDEINVGVWQMITLVRNSTSISGYVNGVYKASLYWDGTDVANSNEFTIGTRGSPSLAQDFSGLIDEVGIWNRALTSTEVSNLYNSGDGLAYPFLGDEGIFETETIKTKIDGAFV